MSDRIEYIDLPDVRDGLNVKERAVLFCLRELQNGRDGRNVPTAMLYGRVVEHVDMSVDEMQAILQRFVGVHGGG
jgi:DNA gyrase/topoisomerase IV subunit A